MPIKNIAQVHDKLYQHLIEKHNKDPEFKFTTRITNRYGRLEEGYWFHGNEHYIAISFWTGTDWMNKTPNIMLVITEEEVSLEISVWDSDYKREFVDTYLVPRIPGILTGGKYYKYLDDYDEDQITDIVDSFLDAEKGLIDRAITDAVELLEKDDNRIWFINDLSFRKRRNRIDEYREYKPLVVKEEKVIRVTDEAFKIQHVHIKSFGKITDCILDDIPKGNRCIFFTGENNAGKSTILKAIGAALVNDTGIIESDYPNADVEITLRKHLLDEDLHISFQSSDVHNPKIQTNEGYAAYGPYRLMVTSDAESTSLDEKYINNSLFKYEAPLLDIMHGLYQLTKDSDETDEVVDLSDVIEETISEILPEFNGIVWDDDKHIKFRIGKVNKKDVYDINDIPAYTYDNLATGAKSVLAMVGDMMIRFFNQQKNANDVGQLKGIVIIDEIDIHLHPKYQKLFVQQLTASFPKVQFIISTHSPVPLLGAPEESVFYLVKKGYDHKTKVEKIDDFHVKNLTPDTILTSPIFGMYDILHSDYTYDSQTSIGSIKFDNLRSESTWNEAVVAKETLESLLRKYRQRKGGQND